MGELQFTITIPTDGGFVGRTCPRPECGRYFRVHTESVPDVMNCPYCGLAVSNDELLTPEQRGYAKAVAIEKAREYASKEIARVFKRATRGSKSLTFRPGKPYRARTVTPRYRERRVDSELRCPSCSVRFQIDGVFSYCIGCGLENIAIYDANLAAILSEIQSSSDQQRSLRHAYNDVVATFEAICSRRARHLGISGSFQDPFEARRFFKKHGSVDICANLPEDQRLTARRVFHKRHVYQHAQGVISERYVQKVPEDRGLLGQKAELSVDALEAGARAVRVMIDGLMNALPEGRER